jgi:hypothetical protein
MNVPKIQNEHVKMLFHVLGLGCLGGAVFLETFVFLEVFFHGRFIGVENNIVILAVELILTLFTAVYLIYTVLKVCERGE